VNPYTGKIPLEIEHIDGNYMNNDENNLDLICPNCHSLTGTYKSLNLGHGRKSRKKYT
jgi:predicted HNH restriction endonuclease